MFCSEHFTGKLDFFTLHFHYNLYLKRIISIISYILSLWNLLETKIVANRALDPFKNLLYSSPENKFSIKGELLDINIAELLKCMPHRWPGWKMEDLKLWTKLKQRNLQRNFNSAHPYPLQIEVVFDIWLVFHFISAWSY